MSSASPADTHPFELRELGPGSEARVLEVTRTAESADAWIERNAGELAQLLERHGALLLRGLQILGSGDFGRLLRRVFAAELLQYRYRSTPRTELREHVYTATEYPSSEAIPQHNESSYAREWPARIAFLCLLPASTGGNTPIADGRRVHHLLPDWVKAKFAARGVMYVRNYSELDLPWQVVFQTSDRSSVERYCLETGLAYEWLADGTLRTVQVNPASILHPGRGEEVWFNQAHLFHVSSLPRDIASTFLNTFAEARLPRNAYYGDGSPIEAEALDSIRSAYDRARLTFPWRRGDILLLDNMLFSHGREPYTGARTVLAGMACPKRFRPGAGPAVPVAIPPPG